MPESYQDRVAALRAAAKKHRRKERWINVTAAIAAVLALIVLVAALLALGALITMLIWNVGIVAVVAACGGHVGHIGFWVALCINLAIGTLRGGRNAATSRKA